jgi:hypothetical protein
MKNISLAVSVHHVLVMLIQAYTLAHSGKWCGLPKCMSSSFCSSPLGGVL